MDQLLAPMSGVPAAESTGAGVTPAAWAIPSGPVAAGEPAEATNTFGSTAR